MHPVPEKGYLKHLLFGNKPGQSGYGHIPYKDIKITSVISHIQDRPVRRYVLQALHLICNPRQPEYEPEYSLYNMQALNLCAFRVFLIPRSQDAQ